MEINEYILKFFHVVKELDAINPFAQFTKLTKTEYRILQEVVLEGRKDNGIISSELARRIGVTRSAISQIVTKLENNGIVKRVAAPDDRKIAYVEIADGAFTAFRKACDNTNEFMSEIVSEFGKDKMDELMQLCEEFVGTVKKLKKEKSTEETL